MIGVAASTTVTPGLYTLSTLQSSVLSFVNAEPDDDNRRAAKDAINGAIDQLNLQVWRKVMGYQDVALVLNQADYTLNRDFGDPRHGQWFNSDGNPVEHCWHGYQDQKTFEMNTPESKTAGDPSAYTIFYGARVLTFNYMPSQAFIDKFPTLRLRYYPYFQHLESDSDTLSEFASPIFNSFLTWYARWVICLSRDVSDGKIREARAMWRSSLQDMKVRDNEIDEDFS